MQLWRSLDNNFPTGKWVLVIICLVTYKVLIMSSNYKAGLVPCMFVLSFVFVVMYLYTDSILKISTTIHYTSDWAYNTSYSAFNRLWSSQDSWTVNQAKLKENIARVCTKYNLTGRNHFNRKQMFHVSKLNLLYCENHKVGGGAS